MTSGSRSMENVLGKETMTLESTQNENQNLQLLKVMTPDEIHLPSHLPEYEEKVTVKEQPFTTATNRVLPVYTLDWASRTDSYFLPVTGLDFLIGVPEVLLLQNTDNLKSSDSSFVVKIPNGETLYLGMENSTSMQRALFCSQRNFNMAFLDPNKQVAMIFIRKGALINFGSFLRQELVAFSEEYNVPLGRIQQENSLSTVSFAVLDDHNNRIYQLVCSESTVLRRLNHDVHFSILDPVNRTGGVILHKWDNNYKDFVYHITFPSRDTSVQHKTLLVGVALLVEYTYFKTNECFCFS